MNDDTRKLHPELRVQTVDHLTATVKGALGAIPGVGSILSELVGAVIPGQRVDRLARFANDLATLVAGIDQFVLRAKLTDENFTDLAEEALRQATQAVTKDRTEYIARLVATGLTNDDVTDIEAKHLLKLLGELNDIEVLWLRSYYGIGRDSTDAFQERHAEHLRVFTPDLNDQAGLDKLALRASYRSHLMRLGLMELDVFFHQLEREASFSGTPLEPEFKHYKITQLGSLLIRRIGLGSEG